MLKQKFYTDNIDITWKTFVRETCDVPATPVERKVHCVAFQGNSAKEAYEEIINEKSESNLQSDGKYCEASTIVNRNPLTKPISTTEKSKSKQISKRKVTVNAILNAVEQKDLNFLSRHVTQENVNSTDDYGWTPLMLAAYCGHLDVTTFLLDLGANRKAREKSGLTAAQLALKTNYLKIVALLKKRSELATNKALLEADSKLSKGNVDNRLQPTMKSELIKPLKESESVKELIDNYIGFYCEICDATFHQTTWKRHETSTLHIFNTKPKLPNTMYGISKQNKGYQMLLNHGWDEESGLGPSGKGMKYPIKTYLKSDRKGLGQTNRKEYRVTHFKSGDSTAIVDPKICKRKCFKKKDREKLLNREARRDRALRMALS